MPRNLSKRVRVRHTDGSEKDVLRSQLPGLSAAWTRVNPYETPAAPESPFLSLPDVAAIPQEPATEAVEETPDVPAKWSDANPEEE